MEMKNLYKILIGKCWREIYAMEYNIKKKEKSRLQLD
jgi:hypothetical protein